MPHQGQGHDEIKRCQLLHMCPVSYAIKKEVNTIYMKINTFIR